jgi:hypothetical protein
MCEGNLYLNPRLYCGELQPRLVTLLRQITCLERGEIRIPESCITTE